MIQNTMQPITKKCSSSFTC